jgi:hypothetical protein
MHGPVTLGLASSLLPSSPLRQPTRTLLNLRQRNL